MFVLWGCQGSSPGEPAAHGNKAISGTITIPGTVLIDSDVNDTNAPYTANDSITTAQTVPNPVTIGGYVNRPGAGPQGRSMAQGDVDDYYVTTLLAGQIVRLMIGDVGDINTGLNALDVSLINSQGDIVSSQGSGTTKTITVSATDRYYLDVQALSGASNYLLNISLDAFQSVATAAKIQKTNQDLDVNRDFVPGEVIVKFKPNVKQNAVISSSKAYNLRRISGGTGRNSLFEIDAQGNYVQLSAVSQNDTDTVKKQKLATLEAIKSLRQRQDVESARPNYIRRAMAVPNDPYYRYQWHYPLINLPQAWEVTTGTPLDGNAVVVAVIDTGILPDHPDLQGQLVAGYDFIRDANNAGDGDGIDDDPFDQGDGVFGNSSFHGTHVAGTVAAATNNDLGVAGVAWGAKVMPLRVLGKQGGTDYDIEQAVRYAAGLENDSGTVPAQRADVINLSLGGASNSTTPPEAFVLARQAGVIIVAAAGNEASNQLSYPASLDGVVSVSAVGIDKNIAPYSNYGGTVDLAAPGGDTTTDLDNDGFADGVLSTLAADERSLNYLYAFYQGTSMATPHVAGVIALMKSVYRDMTPQQFDQWLGSGLLTEDLGSTGRDNYYGNGLIDAYKAVTVASDAAGNALPQPDPAVSASEPVLNFSYDKIELNFAIRNGGGGSLVVQTVNEDSTGWLSVMPVSVDESGLGIYSAILDRALLPGEFSVVTANITVETTAGALDIPVIALSGAQNTQNDAGVLYIQLIDTVSGQPLKQVQATAANGQYAFTLDNIPFGNYIVIAGSNPDNNGLICDVAEACGEYPSVGYVEEITISESSPAQTLLNFETSFKQIAITQAITQATSQATLH